MRLNLDCIRDFLLCVEENTDFRNNAIFIDEKVLNQLNISPKPALPEYNVTLFDKYTADVVLYHLHYCIKADLIEFDEQCSRNYNYVIIDLTPKGHNFMANIRHKTIFEKTKAIAQKIGIESLPSFVRIAESTTSEIIKSVIFST